MNQAIADPDQLRQFAAQLRLFSETLRERSTVVAGQLNQLQQSWRDEQQRAFSENFLAELKQLSRVVAAADEHIPYLLRKADQIDAYLER
ncbi:MAG: WXG100 family type VII secretion target [Planctomycetota bacterium]